ncbi:MAG: PTS system mannose/fructose/sorbose family transporter subunit IID [Erysipelotrichaceae bacterium]|nr:PTS system mannose/fructose/sorbose family transporter subunit IID [Erysipelotrichaceae bacterium]
MSEKKLDRSLLTKVFWRSYQALGCYSYDKQQGIAYMRALLPVLEKLYPDQEDYKEALRRHNSMFNTTCAFVPFCLGITCAQEEEFANSEKGSMTPESIQSVKIALMGPLAGIGDSFFWGTFRVIGVGIGAPMAAAGNFVGVILYLLINLIPSTLTRWYGFWLGYKGGTNFLFKMQLDGTLDKLTEAAKILALTVIGGLVVSNVRVPVAMVIQMGGGSLDIAATLNGIMPNLLPLLLSIYVYHLIQKGMKINTITYVILIVGILLTAIGFFG